MAKEIPLSQGKVALVDDADYEWLMGYKWHYLTLGYAAVSNGRGKSILMHRLILDAPPEFKVDHINQDKLDNQRHNLRFCTMSQNLSNRGKVRNNTSGYKGVFQLKGRKDWFSQIKVKGKIIYLGYFKTREEAALAYNNAAVLHHGEFARLNEILPTFEPFADYQTQEGTP